MNGDEKDTEIPDNMRLEGMSEGLFYMGHSHVNENSCLQSDFDFASLIKYNVKYSWTINGGFMIVKNTKQHLLNPKDYNNNLDKMEEKQKETKRYKNIVNEDYDTFETSMRKQFKKYVNNSNNREVKRFRNKVPQLSDNEMKRESGILQDKFISKKVSNFINKCDNSIKDENIEIYYNNKKEKK